MKCGLFEHILSGLGEMEQEKGIRRRENKGNTAVEKELKSIQLKSQSAELPDKRWTTVLWRHLVEPVDNSSLVAFRVLFGLLLFYECWTFCRGNYRKAEVYYVQPEFAAKYFGFEWIRGWSPPGMGLRLLLRLMMASTVGISVGAMYHFCAMFFALSWTYIILLDALYYLNHFYLISIIAFLLVFVPANAALSVDAWLFPSLFASNSAPRYTLYIFQLEQVCAITGVKRHLFDMVFR